MSVANGWRRHKRHQARHRIARGRRADKGIPPLIVMLLEAEKSSPCASLMAGQVEGYQRRLRLSPRLSRLGRASATLIGRPSTSRPLSWLIAS